MKQKWRDVRPYIVAGLIYRIADLLGRTLRLQTVGWDQAMDHVGGKIYAVWHGRTLIGAILMRDRGTWSIISQSKDGDMQNTIFRRFGFKTIRGSTKRGGVGAAIESVRALRGGGEMAFTPDGPRGPSGIVQDGIVLMARKSGVPVYPCATSAQRRWLIKSWDRYLVPKPFSKAVVVFGEPLFLADNATAEEQEDFRQKLEKNIHAAEREAEGRMGHIPPTWHQSPFG